MSDGDIVDGYPLHWPPGKPRTTYRPQANFGTGAKRSYALTIPRAVSEVHREIGLLGGRDIIVSTNLRLTRDGLPSGNQGNPKDPGAAVYFLYRKKQQCFACDSWHRVEDNLYAIAMTIGALRGIARWGSGDMVAQAFTGFVALPAPTQFWHVLGFKSIDEVTRDEVASRYSRLAMQRHPDRPGGSDYAMSELNWARDAALEFLQERGR